MKFPKTLIAASLSLLGSAGMAHATPIMLSNTQMGGVSAGQSLPYLNISNFNSTGAIAFATSNALSTPSGSAIVNANITTNIGLNKTGFTDFIQFSIVH